LYHYRNQKTNKTQKSKQVKIQTFESCKDKNWIFIIFEGSENCCCLLILCFGIEYFVNGEFQSERFGSKENELKRETTIRSLFN
jgi:hypothetical protein